MMRIAPLTGLICLSIATAQPAWAETSKGFQLTVAGKQVGIDVGETLTVTTDDGKEIKISLDRSKLVTTSGAFFSFDHPGDLSLAETDLGKGIKQYFLSSAVGTSIIVQEYDRFDASSIASQVIKSMTKTDKKAGSKIKKIPTERRLDSGKTLKGMKTTVSNKSSRDNHEALSYGNSNKAIVIMTGYDENNGSQEGAIIDTFWKSLKINF